MLHVATLTRPPDDAIVRLANALTSASEELARTQSEKLGFECDILARSLASLPASSARGLNSKTEALSAALYGEDIHSLINESTDAVTALALSICADLLDFAGEG